MVKTYNILRVEKIIYLLYPAEHSFPLRLASKIILTRAVIFLALGSGYKRTPLFKIKISAQVCYLLFPCENCFIFSVWYWIWCNNVKRLYDNLIGIWIPLLLSFMISKVILFAFHVRISWRSISSYLYSSGSRLKLMMHILHGLLVAIYVE